MANDTLQPGEVESPIQASELNPGEVETPIEQPKEPVVAGQAGPSKGYHIRASDGSEHLVEDLDKAKTVDPKLTVLNNPDEGKAAIGTMEGPPIVMNVPKGQEQATEQAGQEALPEAGAALGAGTAMLTAPAIAAELAPLYGTGGSISKTAMEGLNQVAKKALKSGAEFEAKYPPLAKMLAKFAPTTKYGLGGYALYKILDHIVSHARD